MANAPEKKSSPVFSIDLIDHEPWIRLPTEEELEKTTPQDLLIFKQTMRFREKYAFYLHAFDFLDVNKVEGDYYEFGCHRARTFRMALTEARRRSMDRVRFYAFDSFQGLPAPTTDHGVSEWKEGALTTTEEDFLKLIADHKMYVDHCRTIKGLR